MNKLKQVFSSAVFRLLAIVLMVVVGLNVLTLVLSSTVIDEVEHQVSAETQSAMDLYMAQVDSAVQRITLKLYELSREDLDFARISEKEVTDNNEYYRQLQSLVNLSIDMDNLMEDNSLVSGIFCLFPHKDIWLFRSGNSRQDPLIKRFLEEDLSEDRAQSNVWRIVDVSGEPVLLLLADYRQAWYGAWIYLSDITDAQWATGTGGSIRSFTDPDGVVKYIDRGDLTELDLTNQYPRINGENWVQICSRSQNSPLCYVQLLPKGEITDSMPSAIRLLLVLSVMALAIIPVLVVTMLRWVVRPVNKLTRAMEHIEGGDMDYRIEESGKVTEFERLNRHFNHMMDEVSELKIDVYEEKLKSQKIKMRFLSQQIQPHFIINTLNILYSYEKEEYPLIQRMLLCLSRYFRYIVNANTDLVEIGRELDHIRNYFEIQQARYLKTFTASVTCEAGLEGCLIPPLIIQNFAENAIKHSLDLDAIVDITVEVRKTDEDRVHICVADNGAGISDEVLEKIALFQQTGQFQKGLGVGIQNAVDRLNIIYGGHASFRIGRRSTGGTRIDIELPLRRKEHSDYERDTG